MTDLELKNYEIQVRTEIEGSPVIRQHNISLISCVEMINSCLAYHPILENADVQKLPIEQLNKVIDYVMNNDWYMGSYIRELGYELVVKLTKKQLKDIKTVKKGVYTDSQGCSYNEIEWVR